MRWYSSPLLAFAISVSLMERFFYLLDRPISEQALLLIVSTLGFGVLLFQLHPRLEAWYRAANHKIILLVQAALAGSVFLALRPLAPLTDGLVIAALGFAFSLPFASGYDTILRKQHLNSLIASFAMGAVLAFFAAGFLSRSYPAYWSGAISILSLLIFGLGSYAVVRYVRTQTKRRLTSSSLGLLTVSTALLFALALTALALRYPTVFDRSRFLFHADSAALFFALALLSPVWLAWTLKTMDERGWLARWQSTRLWTFVHTNLPGLVLAGFFSAGYTVLSYVFNHPSMDLTENFLAADGFAWMDRLASADGASIEMRAVHPFAFFIFRPIVWLFSLLFNGDRFTATFLLVPLTGGLCVLLAYLFVKRWSGSQIYALLVASILGASAAHLVFASIVESYIFSAAALLLFFLLLLDEKTHLFTLVAVGALTFGITITNFIQTFIGFVVARPKFKSIFMYGLLASALSITLTILHAAAYPSALMFFDPAGAGVESEYSIPLLGQPAWRLIGRAVLLLRNIFLYGIVAPKPFILTTEVGSTFPRFNFYKLAPGNFSYSSYEGVGKLLILAWGLLIVAAAAAFVWKIFRTRKLDLTAAFPLALIFTLWPHMTYGSEPFLYAANWTYALLLFVAASLSDFGRRRWFQIFLWVFLVLLMINQWGFIQTILSAIAPFFK